MLLGGQGEKGKQIFNDTLNTFYIYGYMASDMSGKEEKQEVTWRLNGVELLCRPCVDLLPVDHV